MLENIVIAKEENVTRSKEIAGELKKSGATPELLAELERIAGPVRREIIAEVLNDLNNLEPLLRGNLVKTISEPYTVEVDDLQKAERYGFAVAVIGGRKVMFDPAADDDPPRYEPVPKMMIEKTRTLFVCETNRRAVAQIEELLKEFLNKLRGELCRASLDTIINEKRAVELAIAKVDRRQLTKENFSEGDFLDATYIKGRPVDRMRTVGPDASLYAKFDAFRQNA